MAKISSKSSLIITIVLMVFLTTQSFETMARATGERKCRKVNEFCGGIAGFTCCPHLKCKLDGTFPDAGGICVSEELALTRECRGLGQDCGGIVGFTCCNGLRCKLEGDFPDAGGVCVKNYFQ